jgi:broad specificity phosphatase PhoE
MSRLILVRHAAPAIDPMAASADWPLSDEGRAAAAALAVELTPFGPAVLISGTEPKMIGTAEAIGGRLGVANQPLAGLSEHQRRSTTFGDRAIFEASIQALFSHPTEVVYGDESADQTYDRFAQSIDYALKSARGASVIAVSGGTAISLFMARRVGLDPFPFWKTLRLPQAFVLSVEPWRLQATIG